VPGKPVVVLRIFGEDVVELKLRRGERAVAEMEPVMTLIAKDMMRVIRSTITGQGRRYGGSWPASDPETIRQKAAKGQGNRQLIATGKMLEAFGTFGGQHQILYIGPHEVDLDTDLDYPDLIQHGTEHMPARPFIDFYPQDRARWANMVTAYLTTAMDLP
jgi:phage gpG-like protein